jgi:xylan 1,4-beta-xylosidase
LFSRYTAASFARIWELAARRGVNLEGVLSWAFEFENQPWFAGYRQLATNGVDLPVLNVFRLFAKLGPDRHAAESSAQVTLETLMADGVRGELDVGVLATRTAQGGIALLLWNYHDDDVPGPDAAVHVDIRGLRARGAGATVWRVDATHANAFSAWRTMGAPIAPDATQYRELELASQMHEEAVPTAAGRKHGVSVDVSVPRQGVALLLVPGNR